MFVHRKSPKKPCKPITSLALSQPQILLISGSNSTTTSMFHSYSTCESQVEEIFLGDFRYSVVDNDDLALWKSSWFRKLVLYEYQCKIRVGKGFVDALETRGLRMYVCSCPKAFSVVILMDGCAIQSRTSLLLYTTLMLNSKRESTSFLAHSMHLSWNFKIDGILLKWSSEFSSS